LWYRFRYIGNFGMELQLGTRSRIFLVILFCLLGMALPGHSAPQAVDSSVPASPESPAAITRVRILLNADSPALEITSDRQLAPQITKLDGPPRLMVDLP